MNRRPDDQRPHASAITREVPLKSIDLEDRTFVVTFAPDLKALTASIARVGIIHPPLLQEIDGTGRYRVVCGYKRLAAAKSLGVETIAAEVSAAGDDLQLFLLGLEENLGTRHFNLVEKSLALDRLVNRFGLSREEILRSRLPALGLGADPAALDLYLSFARLEDEIKKGLASEKISFATGQQLASLSSADRLAFGRLISALRMGHSRQRELLALCQDICRREGISLCRLLEDPHVTTLMADSGLQLPVISQQVRQLLIKRRYPRFSQAVDQFAALKKKLRLPPYVSLTASPFFEGQDWRLTVNFRNRQELDAALRALRKLSDSSHLDELLHFTLREEDENG